MAKKMVRYLALSKMVDKQHVTYFPDFKGRAVVTSSPMEATFASLKLLNDNVEQWLETHERLPEPKTTVDMADFDQCIWIPVMVDEENLPENKTEKSLKDGTDDKIFTLEELENDLGLDLN